MSNPYGPWATSINAGSNPQLSTFWRRRLTMLVPASQTSPTLSRRNLLCLSAAAMLVMIVPTVRLAVAAGDAESSLQGGANTAKATDQASPSKGATAAKPQGGSPSGHTIVAGIFSTASSPMDFYLPSIAYHMLNSAVIRRELGVSDRQEKALREISRDSLQQRRELLKKTAAEMEKRSPAERAAGQDEYTATVAKDTKAVRKQIERLLDPDQLAALISVGAAMSLGRLMDEPNFGDKVGISNKQRDQLSRVIKEQGQKSEQSWKSQAEAEKRMLALLTPPQWDQLERNPAGLFDNNSFPIGELYALLRSDLNGQLRLSAKQQAKCQEISTRSQSRLEELLPLLKSVNSVLPMKERDANRDELTRKMNAMAKEDREQINNLLTKEQAAMLRRIVVQQAFLHAIEMPGCFQIAADINPNSAGGLFDRIQATPQQREEWRRLCEENVERTRWRQYRKLGEAVLMVLTPQQQDEYIDAIDTLSSASSGRHARSDAKKVGEMPKTGAGSVIGFSHAESDGKKKPAASTTPSTPKEAEESNK